MEQDKLTTTAITETPNQKFIICSHSKCGAIADGEYKCTLCSGLFCVNCMYVFCNKCNRYFMCFWCGYPWLQERKMNVMDPNIFCGECIDKVTENEGPK